MNPSRRNLLKYGGLSLGMIPVVAIARKNDGMRASMKYKDSPEGDKECSNCVQVRCTEWLQDLPGRYRDFPEGLLRRLGQEVRHTHIPGARPCLALPESGINGVVFTIFKNFDN